MKFGMMIEERPAQAGRAAALDRLGALVEVSRSWDEVRRHASNEGFPTYQGGHHVAILEKLGEPRRFALVHESADSTVKGGAL